LVALYLLSLGVSAGLTGVFGHHLLEGQGYAPAAFRMDVVLAAGIACAYMAVQLLYMTTLRLLYPTRAAGPLVAEVMSHLGALALIPYLLEAPVEWPHPILFKVEPLIYLGMFGAIHGFFKLVSFYASISGKPAGRLGALGWLLGCGLTTLGACAVFDAWLADAQENRPTVSEEAGYYRTGGEYARARVMPEGAELVCPAPARAGQCLTFRWANLPGLGAEEEPLDTVYVTAVLEGTVAKRYSAAVVLRAGGWAEFRVPAEGFPANTQTCAVTWTAQREPAWRALAGLRPMVTSHRRLLVSGPFAHQTHQGREEPNIILIAVEGLGAEHLACMGYNRDTTPALDRLAYSTVTFANAYTPAPEAPAACMTLLTGLTPLRHGYLGDHRGPLPAHYQTLAEVLRQRHYATAAFTEGDGGGDEDLVFGSGFERGFEIFDSSYAADSRITLEKAAAWIDAHAGLRFMVFVRLCELRDSKPRVRYGDGFAKGKNPRTLDVYDGALRYVDEQLGAFVKHIRNGATRKNTCMVVTSTYGLDFSRGRNAAPERLLTEACLRVPLFLLAPGVNKDKRAGVIALEDVMPTLLDLARVELDYPVDGRSFLKPPVTKEPVSMMGKPLVLSLRSGRWRFTWRSGRLPFAARSRSEGQVLELYDVTAAQKRNSAAKNPQLVTRYRDYLEAYLDERCQHWPQPK